MPQSKRDPISVETGRVPTIPAGRVPTIQAVRPMKKSMVWTLGRKHCGTLLTIRLGANRDDLPLLCLRKYDFGHSFVR